MAITGRGLLGANSGKPTGCYGIGFGTYYSYYPNGTSDVSRQSRLLCARVKTGHRKWVKRYAARVRELTQSDDRWDELFRGAILVPIPPSIPGRFSAVGMLAGVICACGLAMSVWDGLSRRAAVKRSSTAWKWQRPTVEQHFASLAFVPASKAPTRITLVDDVITKGRTVMAAALRVRAAYPRVPICAFALLRTVGLGSELASVRDPCLGTIRWNGEDVCREP